MAQHAVNRDPVQLRLRRRARLRFALANAQMFAAAVAIVLVFQLGLSWPTCAAAFVSFTLSAVSRTCFRPPNPPEP